MPVSAQSGKYFAREGKTRSCRMACCQWAPIGHPRHGHAPSGRRLWKLSFTLRLLWPRGAPSFARCRSNG